MSLPNPINITYILTSEVVEYAVKDTDYIINVDTLSSPISIYLPNIRNSDMLSNPKNICINDGTNNALDCPITVYACGGDKINGRDFVVLNKSGISAQISFCNISEWACLDLELKLPIETPIIGSWDGVLDFSTDHIYGTYQEPVDNADISYDEDFPVSGATNLVIHNANAEPTLSVTNGNFVLLNGVYVPDVNNFYYFQCTSQNYIIYTISQEQ
jgi:hypothetical protein